MSYTPREVAKILRCSPDRVRALIRRGELPAVNMATALCGRPRFVVLSEGLQSFLNGRAVRGRMPRSAATPRPGFVEYIK